ncbi:MAG: HK97 family phage prohead protease [Alphaproteobacteria bacterium]|nr:HK97 family phage prohead protease [Alphaproteobacteria bacterium]
MGQRLAGYAAVFDVRDRGGDVVRRGAFAGALAAGGAGVPLLWQHDAARPIGRVTRIGEDRRGLRVVAEIEERAADGANAAALLRAGAVDGLSIGYRVKRARGRPGGGRELIDVELIEVSVVTFPMQPLARVLGLSGAGEETGA